MSLNDFVIASERACHNLDIRLINVGVLVVVVVVFFFGTWTLNVA